MQGLYENRLNESEITESLPLPRISAPNASTSSDLTGISNYPALGEHTQGEDGEAHLSEIGFQILAGKNASDSRGWYLKAWGIPASSVLVLSQTFDKYKGPLVFR